MSHESFPSGLLEPDPTVPENPQITEEENSFREKVLFPHVKPIIALLEKEFIEDEKGFSPETKEAMEDILYAFLEQRIERGGVYRSEKHEAAFPWGVTDTGELAKMLYRRSTGALPDALAPNEEKKKIEFMFTSLQTTQQGSQFALMEEALHQAIKDLPVAWKAIRAGKEPNANAIYTLGSPTNRMGTVSRTFVDRLKEGKAFDEFGALYAEFVEKVLSKESEAAGKTEVLLYGESMAASFAAGTAEHLMKDGAITQSREAAARDRVPFLQMRLDMPVGSSTLSSARKKFQIPAGFVAQALYTGATDSYIRSIMTKDGAFLKSAETLFAERGMHPDMSDEQVALKKEGIKETIGSLSAGTPIPEGLKVTKVVGKKDPLLYSPSFNKEMDKRMKGREGTLAENMAQTGEGERTFSINMSHNMPYFRENELKRMRGAAEALAHLKNQ